jgi:cytochrome b pre-mRNA-processing protein 3
LAKKIPADKSLIAAPQVDVPGGYAHVGREGCTAAHPCQPSCCQSIANMLDRLFRRTSEKLVSRAPVEGLYAGIVRQAREPAFYGAGRIPDTVEGRFEALALHGFLLLYRLKQEGEEGRALGQEFFDTMFADIDRNLREIGIGDMGVGPRIKMLAQNFYGRIKSYEEGLEGAPGILEAAIERNLLTETATAKLEAKVGGAAVQASPFAGVMADYIRRQSAVLAGQGLASLEHGEIVFAPVGFEAAR